MQVHSKPNAHEIAAWRRLIELGARRIDLGGKPALDVTPIRLGSAKKLGAFVHAFHEVAGRSGAIRRHVNRQGQPIFVVADSDPEKP